MFIIVITSVYFTFCIQLFSDTSQSTKESLLFEFYVTILECVIVYTTSHDETIFIPILKNYENLLTPPKYQSKLEYTFDPFNHIATRLSVRYGFIFKIYSVTARKFLGW